MSEESKRFAVFAPNMAGGGAERAALQLAGGLAERGHQVDLVLSSAQGPRMTEVPARVRLVDLGARRVLTSLPALVRYLRSHRPDAMASVLDHANILLLVARRLAGYPQRVVVIEQNNLTSAAANGGTLRDRMMPFIARRFYPWADSVVGVSAGVVADLGERLPNLPKERLGVIFNPIVTPELLGKARAPVEHPWFEAGDPVFVAAGRLRPQKDFPTLLEAFAEVRKTRFARLLILGEGSERRVLEAQIGRLGLQDDIELHGYTDNPYAYMARATAFVLSSRWEGLPTVLVEALSCGAPIVATDCPSGPREILQDGRYGLLVPVGDSAALARGLIAALDGQIPPPPKESWWPYQLAVVVDEYQKVLSGDS